MGVLCVQITVARTGAVRAHGGWGYDGYGQLGDGFGKDQSSPIPVHNLSGALDVAAGRYHTCARLDSGGVQCWGYNNDGQIGDGTQNIERYLPTNVAF
jgi:alpha-tubulin suppressor-like RCC1 family protein